MATIYSPGSRRSANPTYTAFTPAKATADNTVPTMEELLREQIVATESTTADTGATRLSEALGAGTLTSSGQGGNISFGGGSPESGRIASTLGSLAGTVGALTGNSDLAAAGAIGSLAGSSSLATRETALGNFASLGASLLGAPAGAVSLGRAALTGNPSLAMDAALSLANPAFGMLNGIANLFGLGTFGGAVTTAMQDVSLGRSVDPTAGLLGSYQLGSAINADVDPIGALINALSPAEDTQAVGGWNQGDQGGGSDGGYGEVNNSAGSGFGSSGNYGGGSGFA